MSARDVDTGKQQSITVTATSGLTEEELRRILDENIDELLERKQAAGEFDGRRDRALAALAEIEALAPAVQRTAESAPFGKDAFEKAGGIVARTRAAIEARDAAALAREEEALDRTLQLFKTLAAGQAAPPGR